VLAPLNELADVGDARGAQQLAQLAELIVVAVGDGGDKVGALTRASSRAPVRRRLACASVAASLHLGRR